MFKKISFFMILMLGLFNMPVLSQQSKPDTVRIEHLWARASATSMAKAGAAFLSIHNMKDEKDTLVGASTPVAKEVEIHGHKINASGIMKMFNHGPLEIPARKTVILKPGGLHLMLLKLDAPLTEGKDFPLTLEFEKAGRLTYMVKIQSVDAMGAKTGHMQGTNHSAMNQGDMNQDAMNQGDMNQNDMNQDAMNQNDMNQGDMH